MLGTLALDTPKLLEEQERLAGFRFNEQYSEYTFGTWQSCVLANGSGDKDDVVFRGPYQGPLRPTALGEQLPHLLELIHATFRTEGLRWVRAFAVQDGLLISHRDFIEFERDFLRIHFPLRTDPGCLHSEDDQVFHMRRGEIWFLNATTVHAACSLSDFRRISICLDFDPAFGSLDSLLKAPPPPGSLPSPCVIDRRPLEPRQLEALYAMAPLLEERNVRDFIRLLGKLHFYRRAGAGDCHDWLIELAARSDNPRLLDKARAFKRFCVEQRRVDEHFSF